MKKIIFASFFMILFFNSYSSEFNSENIIPLNYISKKIDIKKLDKKNKKLLFVTTWCKKCKEKLEQIKEEKKIDNYIYIFGNYGGDNIDTVNLFLNSHPELKYVFFDENDLLKNRFNIKIVPSEIDVSSLF